MFLHLDIPRLGSVPPLLPTNVKLSPAPSELYGPDAGAYVEAHTLVVGLAPALGGIIKVSGGGMSSSATIPFPFALSSVKTNIPTVFNVTHGVVLPNKGIDKEIIDWRVTFKTNMSAIPLLKINTTLLTGLNPIVSVTREVAGSAYEEQRVTVTCASGSMVTGLFGLALGGEHTSPIAITSLTGLTITAALTQLPGINSATIGIITPVAPTTSLSFTVTFVDVDPTTLNADVPYPLPLMSVAPPMCLNSGVYSAATAVVTRVSTGNIQHIAGYMELQSVVTGLHGAALGSTTVSVPANASASDLSQALATLGYGSTTVTRTAGAVGSMGSYTWSVNFLEETKLLDTSGSTRAIVPSSSLLVNSGQASLTWTKTRAPLATCCLNSVTFYLNASHKATSVKYNASHQTSLALSLASSAQDVANACAVAAGVDSVSVFATQFNRPAGGRSWFCEFLRPLPTNAFSAVTVATPSGSKLSLNGDISQASLTLSQTVAGLTPEVQRVFIHGDSTMRGFFRLSLVHIGSNTPSGIGSGGGGWNRTTDLMQLDWTAPRIEDELMEAFGLERIRVVPVNLDAYPGVSGDYRAWDVQFTSCGGQVPLMRCIATNVTSALTPSSGAACTVTRNTTATSSGLHGAFSLVVNGAYGSTTITMPYNITAPAFVAKVQGLAGLSVNVTTSVLEPDGGREWLVTFPPTVTQSVLTASTSGGSAAAAAGLYGTQPTVTVTTVQQGSTLGGSFRLYFGGVSTALIPYTSSAIDLQDALTTAFSPRLNGLATSTAAITFDVEKEFLPTGPRWLVTMGYNDAELLQVNGGNVTGRGASVRVYEVQRGVGKPLGTFTLGLADTNGSGLELSPLIDVTSTATDIQTALSSMSMVGDIRVTSQHEYYNDPTTSSSTALVAQNQTFLVTFTTLGSPNNAGSIPLFSLSSSVPIDGSFAVLVDTVQAACCDVSVSYNGQEYSQSLGVIFDDVPIISDISPGTGSSSGGTLVRLRGSGFVVPTAGYTTPSTYCRFGTLLSPATVVSDTEVIHVTATRFLTQLMTPVSKHTSSPFLTHPHPSSPID